jgi:hypothetical protein
MRDRNLLTGIMETRAMPELNPGCILEIGMRVEAMTWPADTAEI